jgi:imidazolonepropionase
MSRLAAFAGRVITCDLDRSTASDPLGVLVDAGILLEDGRILHVGPRAEIFGMLGRLGQPPTAHGMAPIGDVLVDAPDAVLTPGLCDAHTHAAFVGSRHDEYVRRMAGASYQDLVREGGGILATMRAVRAARRDDLALALAERVARMAALGVTTVEVKSGYGLDADSEQRQLEAAAEVAEKSHLSRIVPTYLALHAVPPEAAAGRAGYVDAAAEQVRRFARQGLVKYVDAYVDQGAFSIEEAETVARAARDEGLGLRFHAGQFADVGAAALAARWGAASADHLENVTRSDLDALARAGTRAVLLPVASFTLAQSPPPVALIREAGVPMVVASDANPGTAPTESLPLALALGVRSYGLTPAEALAGATREAAHSLGLGDRVGVLGPGYEADFVVWDLPHEHAIVQPWGGPKVRLVCRAGRPISPPYPTR